MDSVCFLDLINVFSTKTNFDLDQLLSLYSDDGYKDNDIFEAVAVIEQCFMGKFERLSDYTSKVETDHDLDLKDNYDSLIKVLKDNDVMYVESIIHPYVVYAYYH